MSKFLKPKEVADRYGCSLATARSYMRQMNHYEKPLRVTISAVEQWEKDREEKPLDYQKMYEVYHRAEKLLLKHMRKGGLSEQKA